MRNSTICHSGAFLALAFFVTAFGNNSSVADVEVRPSEDQSAQRVRPISDFFRPSMYFVNGELRGYKLYPGSVPELFSALGFEIGDLVTAIDRQPLTDPQNSFDFLNRIGSGETVRVAIERDGEAKELEVNSQRVSLEALAAQRDVFVRPLSEILRPTPSFVNGQQSGYLLYPGGAPEVFSGLGLLPGDLLKEINGQPLNDARRSFELFKELARGKVVLLTIDRQGEVSELEVQVE